MTSKSAFFSDTRLEAILQAGFAYEQSLNKQHRERTGTFYTPWTLANRVVRIALEPLFQHTDGSPKTPKELRALRFCDPALGTGVFLLATCVQLTEQIVRLETESSRDDAAHVEPDSGKELACLESNRAGNARTMQFQQTARHVVENCLFGADIDAKAVLLARQALWKLVSGEDVAMPSDFLNQHVVVADSLKSSHFQEGTFDAVLGNPPFLGGRKIRRMLGDAYFHFLTEEFAPGASGNADLCAFFFRLAMKLLRRDGGVCGFLATSSIGEGDTRATGLDVLVQNEGEIFHAEMFPWPSDASVHAAMVFVRFALPEVPKLPCWLDGKRVPRIFTSLKTLDTSAVRHVFPENRDLCFQGSVLAAKGFILTPEEAAELLEREPQSREIVRPYFTGDEVFQATDTLNLTPRRCVIAFHDRTEEQARQYPIAFQLVQERVFPVRSRARREAHRRYWWQFGDKRPALWQKIHSQGLHRILLQTRHAKFLAPTFVPADAIYSESVVLFPSESFGLFALLNSGIHDTWARQTASTLGRELRYTPSDAFDTFPLLSWEKMQKLESLGQRLFQLRKEHCQRLGIGLTRLYTQMHQPENADLGELRELHQELDCQVLRLYGWDDLAEKTAGSQQGTRGKSQTPQPRPQVVQTSPLVVQTSLLVVQTNPQMVQTSPQETFPFQKTEKCTISTPVPSTHAFRETPLGVRFGLNLEIQQEILRRILDTPASGE